MSIKKISLIMLPMIWIVLLADAKSAVVTSAQWKELTARVRALETALEVDAEKENEEEEDDNAGLRVIVDKIEQFIAELSSLRKEVFGKIKQIRQDIKENSGEILVIKRSYKALSKALGDPAIMHTIASDAKTLFAIVAAIDKDIVLIKQMLNLSGDSSADVSSSSSTNVSSASVASA